MASAKIGSNTSRELVTRMSNNVLLQKYKSANTRGRDKPKLLKEIQKRGLSLEAPEEVSE